MHNYWRSLNMLHTEICNLSAHFEAGRLYEDGLQKGGGKGNRYGI
ncbi:hypothetical protein SAMN02910291_02769 [Desulfovibrio desulfuricans]|uniref:Uncharacterized protein n=1 Tax=Desulfovibrio desulfuricans TaxID=876 RepID=A0AA94HV79_DESDE|nr:hypothetical protein SAMN02910291_02769 [Desulfovibrio desulfuricans]SPD36262.1 Hypothetical protein DSVG11_2175 [Desulfovibrio sp. G11]